jgi:hypothetical protein
MITWASKADKLKLDRIRKLIEVAKKDPIIPVNEYAAGQADIEWQWIRSLEDILDNDCA